MATLQQSLSALSASHAGNSQATHRVQILNAWLEIAQRCSYNLESAMVGKQTLDIGCGQGDMIAVFAAALKEQGNPESKVVGVDPASLDYGGLRSPPTHPLIPSHRNLNRGTMDPRPGAS
jgi:2-polyprenyl-3-methyl-5-hydroxy-6-metoxy-1,4-benzoquinol methylase